MAFDLFGALCGIDPAEMKRKLALDAAEESASLDNAVRVCPQCGNEAQRGIYSEPFCSETCKVIFSLYWADFVRPKEER